MSLLYNLRIETYQTHLPLYIWIENISKGGMVWIIENHKYNS